MRKLIIAGIIIGFPAFGLNLLWENLQCRLFFIHTAEHCRLFMAGAAMGDVLVTLGAWFFFALLVGDIFWFSKNWDLPQWIGLETIGILLSLTVEVFALGLDRWAYTALNPLIPMLSVSVIPLLQLTILFPLVFLGAGKILNHMENKTKAGNGTKKPEVALTEV